MDHSKLVVNDLLELDVIACLLGDVCLIVAALVIAEGTHLALQGLC